MKNTETKMYHGTNECASSKVLVSRSQVLLRCLELLKNYFLGIPACAFMLKNSVNRVKLAFA